MPDTKTIKYKDLLLLMESLEQGMKHYYEGLSRRFTQPDLQRIWITMAEQEETHTRLVRLMRKRSRDDELRNSDIEVNVREYETINAFLQEYPEILTEKSLSLQKGFEVAVTMESLELSPIFKPFIAKQDKPTQDVLEELLESEDMHLNILVKAIRKYVDDPEFQEWADKLLKDKTRYSI